MTIEFRGPSRTARRLCFLASLLSLTGCQSKPLAIETGGETHFLKSCSPDDDVCGEHLSCVCGVCTVLCDDAEACSVFPGAACVDSNAARQCGSNTGKRRCDVECTGDGDCAVVSPFHVCFDGTCRTMSPPLPPLTMEPTTVVVEAGAPSSEPSSSASSEGAPSSSSSAATTSEPAACASGEVSPNEVLVIGDGFFGLTHQFTGFLEEFARAAGALGQGERYRDGSRPVANLLGNDQIQEQYLTAAADNPVRVVIMNGGGADVLTAMCDAPFDGCQPLLDARGGAERLLAAMAAGGVSHAVYVYYPNPQNPDLQAKIDFLRPLLETTCAEAPVACHWIDLRSTFEGNYGSYIGPDGIMPTAEGSRATAQTVWDVMQTQCIAQ